MKRTLSIAAIALGVLIPTTASASEPPSFDSDCVSTQWVIRNRGPEPFNVGTPAGDIYMAIGAVWAPTGDLDSVVISDTVIVRPGCEVFASPTPARLPATGTPSLILAVLALALVATGAVATRVGKDTHEH